MSVKILAIESSCDETAAAVVEDGRYVLSSEIYTQIPLHEKFGGVVPEIASRNHVAKLPTVVDTALSDAGVSLADIDAIAVTCGPGLVGALLCGVSYAKGLAYAAKKPLVPVNHIEGHICANYITHKNLEPPFVCLVVSGGHSHIVVVEDHLSYRLMGATRDDAAGEAYDKVARILGLGYPGGPKLEALAREGDPHKYAMPVSFRGETHLDFSFSGIKTAVVNLVHKMEQKGEEYNRADVAASFQQAVVTALVKNTIEAAKRENLNKIALAGGVSANSALRDALSSAAAAVGMEVYLPNMAYCTDNAAMIGSAAYYRYLAGARAGLDLNANPSLSFLDKNQAIGLNKN